MKKLIVPVFTSVFLAGCATYQKSADIPIIDTHIHLYEPTGRRACLGHRRTTRFLSTGTHRTFRQGVG
ncbi:MAG: hypothetical protein Ct9H300mP7_4980 [Verrucomicrobiota bacterium]|nr:MAG: hypothetical protein Ct9H300mP7_4980 [Verrucomicrobiota bacterium]